MKPIHIIIVTLFLSLSPLVSIGQSVFEVKFIAGMTQYRAALVLFEGGTGKMRVRYYTQDKGTVMVEQTIRIENTVNGMRLTGYNPVYPGTSVRNSSYVADNFYISQNEYGSMSIINIDDRGTSSTASIRLISNSYDRRQFLSGFEWVLN